MTTTSTPEPTEPTDCPRCGGRGSLISLHDGESPCRLCDETGTVSPEALRRFRLGCAFRDARLVRRVTLNELARFSGHSVVTIGEMERGLREIPDELWRHFGGKP